MRKIFLCFALLSLLVCAACSTEEATKPEESLTPENVQEKVSAFLRGENKGLIEELTHGQE
ncbi:MAG: hypothetical protein E7408_03790 [Ruminococcaceae bacterium]|nr:hypothetical protein [Oscillospiraceae bacterium]